MGTTDKKKKDTTGSVDNDSGNTDASASLQARRAKLRGALGGRNTSYPADPFTAAPPSEPYSAPQTDPYSNQSSTYGAQQDPYTGDPYQSADPYGQPSTFSGQTDSYGTQPQEDYNSSDPYGLASQAFDYSQENETPVNVYGVPITAQDIEQATAELEGKKEPEPIKPSSRKKNTSALNSVFEAAPPTPSASSTLPAEVSGKTAELVESIDQSLNVCATNLAALQNLSGEQTNVLRSLAQTLQNQTLLEIGLNLNSLTESLTAALEPMKAIGELVPALDSLVTALEGREQQTNEKLSPDQLVTSLADQLSAGLIDPWTFKCAYMAVYPSDPPAELLHRLVELLGQQRISGDLFRAAYEAVQAAEAPPRSSYSGSSGGEYTGGPIDDNVRAQLDGLERSNREMQRRLDEREQELSAMLSQKESELQAVQEQLNQRLEELNNRYSDAADMISSREEEFRAALESKDMDLIEKDAELNMLRNQMEELRSQTEDMVRDLQKEMISLRDQVSSGARPDPGSNQTSSGSFAAQPADQNFFDNKPNQQRPGLFEAAPNKPAVFASDPGTGFDAPVTSDGFGGGADSGGFANPNPQYASGAGFQAPQAPTFQPPQPTFQTPSAAAPAPPQPSRPAPSGAGPGPSPPTTPFGGQSGSYGMGVRQQVFEVIVRQALAGAPWREICAGPMQVNNISPDEVEAEVKRRQSLLNK